MISTVNKLSKICIELDEELSEELNLIGREEGVDINDLVMKLLRNAIKQWKKEFALEKLKNGEWTIGKAARFLGIPFTKMVEIVENNRVPLGERKIL